MGNMTGLLWLITVCGALVDISTWEAHLKAINSLLPLTTAESLTICYYFDLAQTCSSAAISRFLSLAAEPDLLT